MAKTTGATCGAKTRAGTPCQQVAGWGTDHVGVGRCKLHGGSTLRGQEHPQFRGGKYAKHLAPEEHVQYEEFVAQFDALAGFEDELRIGMFRGYQALMAAGTRISINVGGVLEWVEPDPKYILQCMDLATKCIERHRTANEGTKVLVEFADGHLKRILEEVGRIIARHVRDPAELAGISADIDRLDIG